MIPFAVKIEGVTKEDQAVWALAVTETQLLTAAVEGGALKWYPLADCTFVKMVPPDMPKPVMIVQPQPGNGIALPNRAARRRIDRLEP